MSIITKTQQAEYRVIGATFFHAKLDEELCRLNLARTSRMRGEGKGTSSTAELSKVEAASLIAFLHRRLCRVIRTTCKNYCVDLDAILATYSIKALRLASPIVLTDIWREVRQVIMAQEGVYLIAD